MKQAPVVKIITVVLIVMVVVIAAGTLYGILRSPDAAPLFRIGGEAGNGEPEGQGGGLKQGQVGVFTGVGRLRIAANGGLVILSITFPYPADDRSFAEELEARTGDFRSIAVDYFSSLPHEQLVKLDEEQAKAEILRRYNTALRLGKIENLYFSDLMIIE